MSSIHEGSETVEVMRVHLEEWTDLLDRIHGHFMALDLAEGYRAGKRSPTWSPLTKRVSQSAIRVRGYLDVQE